MENGKWSTTVRYGVVAGVIALLSSVALFWIDTSNASYSTRELVGFISIIMATSIIFFALRDIRDNFNKGELTFFEGIKYGLTLAVFPALMFGLFTGIYIKFINPRFPEDAYNQMVARAHHEFSGASLANQLRMMEEQKLIFSDPLTQGFVMFATVFCCGVIVSVLATTFLRIRRLGVSSRQ